MTTPNDALDFYPTPEMCSSNLYLYMSVHFQKLGLNGFAHWMKKQAEDGIRDDYR